MIITTTTKGASLPHKNCWKLAREANNFFVWPKKQTFNNFLRLQYPAI
jgi:hypothetical protein